MDIDSSTHVHMWILTVRHKYKVMCITQTLNMYNNMYLYKVYKLINVLRPLLREQFVCWKMLPVEKYHLVFLVLNVLVD